MPDQGVSDEKVSTCQRCGRCCSLIVQLSPEEIGNIGNKTGIPGHEFYVIVDTEDEQGAKILKRVENTSADGSKLGTKSCMFLRRHEGKNSSCSIYEIRPKICRLYPGNRPCLTGLRIIQTSNTDKSLL